MRYHNTEIKCPECGWLSLKIKDDKAWICKRCGSKGSIDAIFKNLNTLNEKSQPAELSEEWKKLTEEK